MGIKKKVLLLFAGVAAVSVMGKAENLPTKSDIAISSTDLYETFRAPDSKYRPFVRWWWNGLRLDENEILRELDLMKQVAEWR